MHPNLPNMLGGLRSPLPYFHSGDRIGQLRRSRCGDEPVQAHYPDCITESLDKAGLRPGDVDAVLFSSFSTFSTYGTNVSD